MFTGIIEHSGTIAELTINSAGGRIIVRASEIAAKLAISASIAVNGCCLTVIHRDKEFFSADLSSETIQKTAFPSLKVGARVNLEQPLTAGKEFGGHFVLGHVDGTGRVTHLTRDGDSWIFGVEVPQELARYIVSKGSITIDGISLTVARWQNRIAEIAVIPYTYEHTNICDCVTRDNVNLEVDILGKYVERYMTQRQASNESVPLRLSDLIIQGF